MALFSGYGTALGIAVFGAGGGIGQAMVQHLLSESVVARVHAFSRRPLQFESNKVSVHHLPDAIDSDRIAEALAQSGIEQLNGVLIATGILHDETAGLQPEKALKDLTEGGFSRVMQINCLLPTLIAQQILPLLPRNQACFLAALSARVGSIGDNRLGGWYSYRASKAALNQILRCLSIEVQRRNPQAVVAGLHPGTVDTELSQPFQKGVPEDKLFSADFSARALLQVVDGLTPEDTGRVFDWQGLPVDP